MTLGRGSGRFGARGDVDARAAFGREQGSWVDAATHEVGVVMARGLVAAVVSWLCGRRVVADRGLVMPVDVARVGGCEHAEHFHQLRSQSSALALRQRGSLHC